MGAAIGIAVLGTLLTVGYRSGMRSQVGGLPEPAAEAASDSIGAALRIARDLPTERAAALTDSAVDAFNRGMTLAMGVAAALLALTAAATYLLYHPRERADRGGSEAGTSSCGRLTGHRPPQGAPPAPLSKRISGWFSGGDQLEADRVLDAEPLPLGLGHRAQERLGIGHRSADRGQVGGVRGPVRRSRPRGWPVTSTAWVGSGEPPKAMNRTPPPGLDAALGKLGEHPRVGRVAHRVDEGAAHVPVVDVVPRAATEAVAIVDGQHHVGPVPADAAGQGAPQVQVGHDVPVGEAQELHVPHAPRRRPRPAAPPLAGARSRRGPSRQSPASPLVTRA